MTIKPDRNYKHSLIKVTPPQRTLLTIYIFCALIAAVCITLFLPPVQELCIYAGERLTERNLNHNHWRKFLSFAAICVILFDAMICVVLLYARRFLKPRELLASLNKKNTKSVSVAIIFFFMTLMCASLYITDGHDWGDDFSEYIQQGIYIAEGSYATKYEGTDIFIGYPHGFPLLIAAVYKLAGFNLLAFKMINVVLYALFIAVLFCYCDKKLSRLSSLIITFLFALSPCLYKLIDCILSDIPHMVFSFICLVLISSFLEKPDMRKKWTCSLGIGVFSFFAYTCRECGLVLLCTLLCGQALALLKRLRAGTFSPNVRSAMLNVIPYATFFLLTCILNMMLFPSHPRKDLSFFSNLALQSVISNCAYYFNIISYFFYPRFIWYAVVAGVLWSMLKFASKDYILIIYALGILGLYIIWPGKGQGIRFMASVLPVFLFFAGRSAEALCCPDIRHPRLRELIFRIYTGIAVFSCLVFMSISLATGVHNVVFGRYLGTGSFTEEAKEMYRYINENISDERRIFFFKPRVLLLTTRSAVFYSLPQPGQAVDTSNFDLYLHTLDHGYGQLISDDEAKQETICLGGEEFTCIHGNEKMRLFARRH